MSSESFSLDLTAILAPIPGDHPCGENLQYAGVHDEIREARRADDPTTKGEWQTELKVADWDTVISVAADALKTRTKDLQLGAWLCEALVKKHGFAGLRDGLKIMQGFHELFWDAIYPEIDDGDLDARANCLALMDRQAAFALKEVELTQTRGDENYSFWKWEKTRLPDEFAKIAQNDKNKNEAERIKQGVEKANEEWNRLYRATPRRFYEEIHARLNECWEGFQGLDRAMDSKFGRQTPGLGELKKSVESVRALVDKLVKEKRTLEPDLVATEPSDGGDAAESAEAVIGGAMGATGSSGVIRGRQEALRRLAEIADYFHKIEPHSPVSYLVGRAVKWGNMPLELWLQEVVKDSTVLGQLQEMLGVKPEGS